MPDVVRALGLPPSQKWNSVVLAVAGTVFARLLIGKLSDKYGRRLCYTWLLILGSIPVILSGLVQTPLQFYLCRFFSGFIGASFVITQVHTSLMFASNVVGTANATSAGWGKCKDCLTIYDVIFGNLTQGIAPETSFENLPKS